jgi:K+-transporting ATPase ATPase C chain
MDWLFRPAFSLLLIFTVLLGFAYPASVVLFAQLAFPGQANGSMITADQRQVGSMLIGQQFTRPEFFWGRPSATVPQPYNPSASAASNLGPSNPALRTAIRARVAALRAADPGNRQPIPIDLVTGSGSGLDPHISPEAAYYQVPRLARLRGLTEDRLRGLVQEHIESNFFGLFGEPAVNALRLNLALKGLENSGGKW